MSSVEIFTQYAKSEHVPGETYCKTNIWPFLNGVDTYHSWQYFIVMLINPKSAKQNL